MGDREVQSDFGVRVRWGGPVNGTIVPMLRSHDACRDEHRGGNGAATHFSEVSVSMLFVEAGAPLSVFVCVEPVEVSLRMRPLLCAAARTLLQRTTSAVQTAPPGLDGQIAKLCDELADSGSCAHRELLDAWRLLDSMRDAAVSNGLERLTEAAATHHFRYQEQLRRAEDALRKSLRDEKDGSVDWGKVEEVRRRLTASLRRRVMEALVGNDPMCIEYAFGDPVDGNSRLLTLRDLLVAFRPDVERGVDLALEAKRRELERDMLELFEEVEGDRVIALGGAPGGAPILEADVPKADSREATPVDVVHHVRVPSRASATDRVPLGRGTGTASSSVNATPGSAASDFPSPPQSPALCRDVTVAVQDRHSNAPAVLWPASTMTHAPRLQRPARCARPVSSRVRTCSTTPSRSLPLISNDT